MMPPERTDGFLADVNVLLAAIVGDHAMHVAAETWFASHPTVSVAMCRASQTGLLRLLSEPAVMRGQNLTQRNAWHLLDTFTAERRLFFAPEPEGLERHFRDISMRDEVGAKRWADDYLLAFATAANLALVTFDKALAARSSNALLLTP